MLRLDVTTYLLKFLIDLLLIKYGVNSHSRKTGLVWIRAVVLGSHLQNAVRRSIPAIHFEFVDKLVYTGCLA